MIGQRWVEATRSWTDADTGLFFQQHLQTCAAHTCMTGGAELTAAGNAGLDEVQRPDWGEKRVRVRACAPRRGLRAGACM